MKANETPEKIWVHELSAMELNVPLKAFHVEYVRTDAFIEKAVGWWMDNFVYTDDVDIKYKTIEDFKNYMKGE